MKGKDINRAVATLFKVGFTIQEITALIKPTMLAGTSVENVLREYMNQ